MSSSKKRIINCKTRGEKVLQILESKKSTVDVGEFTTTIKFLLSVLSEYLDTKSNYRPQCNAESKQLEIIMIEYSEFLEELINIGRFLRFFTSNRVRKRLDHINTQIYKHSTEIYLELQQKAKGAKKGANIKKNKEVSPYAAELEKLSSCFRDDEARVFWENNFEQAFMISWNRFIDALKQSIQLDPSSTQHLQYILDNSNTGFISMSRFSDFLNGFGPLKQCVEKVENILNAEWFHGFLSSTETERLLDRQPSGTFLIRFSKSKPGSFAIGYVEGEPGQKTKVTHTLISCAPPSGFKIEEAYHRNARGRLFATLFEVVDFYNYLLKYTFRSDLSRLSWFHGDLSSQEADELLGHAENGSYLVRFSTTTGYLAVSYVKEKNVKHALLECLPNGYRYDNKPHVYKTLTEMVNDLSDTLRHPCSNLTYELNPAFQKQVVFNSADGEATLAPVAPKNAPGSGNYASLSDLKSYHPPTTPAQEFNQNVTSNGVHPVPNAAAPPALLPMHSSYGEVDLSALKDDAVKPNTAAPPAQNSAAAPPQYQVPVSNYMSIPDRQLVTAPAVFTTASGNYGTIPTPGSTLPTGSISPPMNGMPNGLPHLAPGGNYGTLPTPGSLALPTPSPINVAPQTSNYGTLPTPGLSASSPPMLAPQTSNYGTLPTPGLSASSNSTPPTLVGSPIPNGSSPPSLAPQSSNYGTIPTPLVNPPSFVAPANGMPNGLPHLVPGGNHGTLLTPGSLTPSLTAPQTSNYGTLPTPGLSTGLPTSPTPLGSASGTTLSYSMGNLNLSSIPGLTLPSLGGLPYSNPSIAPTVAPAVAPISQYGTIPTSLGVPSLSATNYPTSAVNNNLVPPVAAQSNYGTIPSTIPVHPAPVHTTYIAGSGTLPNNGTPAASNYGVIPTPGLPTQALPTNYPSLPNTAAPASAMPPMSQYGSLPSGSLPGVSPLSPNRTPSSSLPISPSPVALSNYGQIPSTLSGPKPASPSISQYGSIPTTGLGSLGGKSTLVNNAPTSPTTQKARTVTVSSSASPSDGNYGSIPTGNSKKDKHDKKEKKSKDQKISSPPSPANYGSIPTGLMKSPVKKN